MTILDAALPTAADPFHGDSQQIKGAHDAITLEGGGFIAARTRYS